MVVAMNQMIEALSRDLAAQSSAWPRGWWPASKRQRSERGEQSRSVRFGF